MGRKIEPWIFCWTIFGSLIFGAVSLPTITTPGVPREFPNFNQNYTFVDNSSIRENLASHSDIDTEVDDLLGKDEGLPNQETEPGETTPVLKFDHEPLVPHPEEREEVKVELQSAAEWIEDEDNETTTTKEESKETTTKIKVAFTTETPQESTTQTLEDIEPYKDGVPLINGSVAGILIGVFLIVCIVGYTALILWRRALERKYGSREMLVDDDMFDPDDIKHFSI